MTIEKLIEQIKELKDIASQAKLCNEEDKETALKEIERKCDFIITEHQIEKRLEQ